jgi:type I restriction enzyme S subunit
VSSNDNQSNIPPNNWTITTLNEISELIRGITYNKTDAQKEPHAGYVPILRANNINIEINTNNLTYIPVALVRAGQYIKSGDIIIAMSSGSKDLVGKTAQARYDFNGGFGAFCGLLRICNEINKKYVGYFMLSSDYKKAVSYLSSGIGINNLRREHIENMSLPIPPLSEQHRIVAKIEELFTKLDAGVDALKKIKVQLKRYRQSVLKHAFEGKLSEKWRELHKGELESASVLLDKIQDERKKSLKGKFKESCLTDTSDLSVLPKEWCWVRLGEIAEIIQIGPFGSQLHQEDYKENGIPIINPKHIKEQKIFPQEMISEDKAEQLSRYKLFTNDIVLGRRGEMGRSAPITFKEDGWLCGTGSLFIRLGDSFNSKLYSLILSEKMVVDYLEKSSIGTTMANLNSMILINLPIQLIPTAEQQAIIEEIETCFAVVDALEETIEHSLKQSERLRQSILKTAFEGKLVPHDPNDEPAKKLLEHIKAERAQQSDKTSFNKKRSPKQKESN